MNNHFSREGAKTRRVKSIRRTRESGYPGSPKVNIQQAVGQLAGRFFSPFVQGVPAQFPRVRNGGQS